MRVSRHALRNAESLVDRWWVDGEPVVHWWLRRMHDLAPDVDLDKVRLTGRPRVLSVRTLLVGWLLVASTVTGDDKMLVNRVHAKLVELHPEPRRRLGVAYLDADGNEQLVTLRQVRYLWNRMVAVVDGSPHFAGDGLDDDQRAERHAALQRLLDGLLDATMPRDLDHAGSYSVDSTYLPSWAKPYWRASGRRRAGATPAATAVDDHGDPQPDDDPELVVTDDGRVLDTATGQLLDPAHDPELAATLDALEPAGGGPDDIDDIAGTGGPDRPGETPLDSDDELADAITDAERHERVRRGLVGSDGTFRHLDPAERAAMTADPDARHRWMARRNKRTGHVNIKTDVFGYQITAAVRVRDDDGPAVPTLCERLVVQPANHGEAESAVQLLTGLVEQGKPLSDVVVDRGFTYRRPDVFHLPVQRLGGQLVCDLHPAQRGVRGTYRGALLVDGGLFSPSLPASLVDLDQPQPGDSRATVRAKLEQFEWRQAWAFKRHSAGPDARHTCPAAGRDARLVCPLKPGSARLDPATHQQTYPDPSLASLPVCAATSVTVPAEVDAWRSQKHPYGTLAWWESYRSRRNAVEGFFGNLKTPGTEHLHRGTTRSFGLAANTLLVGLLAAATNLRLLATFKADHAAEAGPSRPFDVGTHDPAPQYRSGRTRRPAPSIAALRQHGAALRRGPRPALGLAGASPPP